MQGHLKDRFEVNEVLHKSKNRLAFLGLDRWNENQPVVVKFVRASAYRPDSDIRERLIRLRGLNHPLVADVSHAVVTPKRDFYMTRAYVGGTQLGSHDPALNERIVRSLVGALSLLGALELVHGRLKPCNIMLTPRGDVTILDTAFPWNAVDDDPSALSFVAPEVLRGERPTFVSDLYSLGALLHFIFSGVHLFQDPDPALLRHKCLYATPTRLEPSADIDLPLSAAVNGLVANEPKSRRRAFNELVTLTDVKQIAADSTPFIGRRQEQARVSQALTTLESGINAILITAETGGGKTRLLDHLQFRGELEGRHMLIGRSFERDNRPFEPIVRIIDQRLRRRDSRRRLWLKNYYARFAETLAYLLPEEATDVSSAPIPPLQSLSHGKLVADLAGILLTLATSESNLTYAFDDVDWSDEGTLEVLEQLTWRANEAHLQIVVTSRPSNVSGRLRELLDQWTRLEGATIEAIALAPMSTREASRMVGLLGVRDPSGKARAIGRSAGNPLFLEECVREGRAADPCSIPQRLTDALLQRFKRHAAGEREVVQVLSLFPKPIDMQLIELIGKQLPRLTAASRLDGLLEGGLVVLESGKVSFRHDGFRRAIYRNISADDRRALHATVYAVLSGQIDDEAVLAYHAEHAGLTETAWNHYRIGAHHSVKIDDFRTANEFFASAFRAAKAARIRVPVQTRLAFAESLIAVGRRKDAADVLRSLHTSADAATAEESAKRQMLLSSAWFHIPKKCLKHSQLAVLRLDRSSEIFPGSAANLARAFAIAGRAKEAREALDVAEDSARRGKHFGKEWHALRGMLSLALCDFSHSLQALKGQEAVGRLTPSILTNQAVCLEHLGKLGQARRRQEEALRAAREYGSVYGELVSFLNLASFSMKMGSFNDARRDFSDALRVFETLRALNPSAIGLPLIEADHSMLLLDTGEYGLARQSIFSAALQSRQDRSSQTAIWLAVKAAETFRRTFDDLRATAALRRVKQSEIFHCEFFVVERALIARSGESMTDERRLSQLEECLALTEKMETLYQQCRVLIELGLTLLRLGRRELCRKRLQEARTLAARNGYAPLAARIDLLGALASDSTRERGRLLQRAYRRSTRMGLAELAAECAFRIGESHADRKRLKSALEYLRKSIASVDDMSEGLPDLLRKRYLAGTWHPDARSLMQQVETALRLTERRKITAPADAQVDPLFRRTYHTAVRMNRAKGIDEVIDILGQTLAKALQLKLIVFLTARGDREFHSFGKAVDKQVEHTIRKLDRTGKDEPFFALPSPQRGSHEGLEAWMPLSFQRHRFGGLYVSMPKAPTEREIEFLTTMTASGATTLAALLWSADPPPDDDAVPGYKGILGRSSAIRGICSQIEIAARSGATVLIEGESGTGKELVARAIHENSSRSNGPFVAVDCGAIPETLIESELFGSCRGSFTGATADRTGLIEASNKGTLFLDEIANTSRAVQAKLLRVLQEREVRRLGDTRGRKVDSRLIAATNADLDTLVARSEFRQDLLYRLNVLHIRIPPLRQRREDIPDIAQAFLKRMNGEHGTRKRFHSSALASLAQGTYRGNVRELQNVIERAYFSSPGQAVVTEITVGATGDTSEATNAEGWFERIAAGRDDFWKAVHRPYKSRDISRERVRALMDVGLRETRGSYKNLAKLLHVDDREYRRFMDFLRRNDCQPDFRLYRRRPDRDRRQEPPEATAG